MNTRFIKELPESMTADIKTHVAAVMMLLKDKFPIDKKIQEEIYNQFRQATMEGVQIGSYILGNLNKDISNELISLQFNKSAKV